MAKPETTLRSHMAPVDVHGVEARGGDLGSSRWLPTGLLRVPVLFALLLLLPGPLLEAQAGSPRPGGATAGGGPGAAVVEPDQGVVGTGLRLRQLDGVKRVLLIAAHPDDEDTGLITALARGWGAEVAYLSLSRGEGGQNLIGPELDEGLGIVRTGELLAARRLDGGLQFFARTFDFGYSKSAEETFQYWPRDEVLADVVWVIRKFRPQVVVSIFPPDARAGHGQHEVAGIVANEAFDVAGDPGRFSEQLEGPDAVSAWAPTKLYRSARFDPESATADLPTGVIDPLLGRSHHQLAMASRSQHRSQDMGTGQDMGPRSTYLALVESRATAAVQGDGQTGGIFAGVDTTLASVADGLPEARRSDVREAIARYREALSESVATNGAVDPDRTAAVLSGGVESLRAALDALGSEAGDPESGSSSATGSGGSGAAVPEAAVREARRTLERKLELAEEALLSAARVVVDARTRDDVVVPGETVDLEVSVWNGGGVSVSRAEPLLDLPDGWTARLVSAPEAPSDDRGFRRGPDFGSDDYRWMTDPGPVAPGTLARWTYRIQVPEDAELSRPYYLEEPRDGEMYRWPEDRSLWGLPRNPPVVEAEVSVVLDAGEGPEGSTWGSESTTEGLGLRVVRAADYVGVDDATGEFRTPLLVAPNLSVQARPGIMAWPLSQEEGRPVTVAVRNQARSGFRGRLRLEAPEGWEVQPEEVRLELQAPGEDRSVTFQVTPPGSGASGAASAGGAGTASEAVAGTGIHELRAVAVADDGARFDEGFDVVDYPHIDRDLLFADATTEVSMFPVSVDEGLRVGYVMGSGDGGAEALSQIGVDVTLLGPGAVREGAFEGFDVILLGVRAYETRPDLVGANQQLLDWVREGGRLIVQYNRYEFSGAGYAPYPVTIDRPHDRVTYEDAPVTILDPESPVFNQPNTIEAADFEG
ncbi:MAG: PIG-L family deacetylase, partial [Longimicrobiales bacterium]|nr:PIG-L family deacetylase [Longimicrobiales bacterium]